MKIRNHFMTLFIMALFFLPLITVAQKTQELSEEELKTWWQKDLEKDTIPGVGLDRAYSELLKDKKGEPVVVAVLDTKLDIEHEDLKDQIWVNKDEIPDNGIDDDNNGYIDDVNGWNFLGNAKGGEVPYQSIEIVRVIKAYEKTYGVNEAISTSSEEARVEYSKAKEALEHERMEIVDNIEWVDASEIRYAALKKEIKEVLDDKVYNINGLDSLPVSDKLKSEDIDWMKSMIEWVESNGMKAYKENNKKTLELVLGLDFDERKFVNGGNNRLKDNTMPFQHSTTVSGVLSATRSNSLGIKGFSDNIKLMPVVMVSYGDEHDQDVANAIRYAVDNGAQIINMSWGKYYSTQKELVKSAIEYAAQKNVLLVSGSGNDAKNIDIESKFPTDYYEGKEAIKNFISTGGITSALDSTLVASFSNYGQIQVDLMAPAQDIYSTDPDNAYDSGNGTSYAAPLVSGTAALLKSYFPKLTAAQLKEIILSSGTKLNLMVKRPGDKKGAPLVTFSSLSKTGHILNCYSAIKMAIELTK